MRVIRSFSLMLVAGTLMLQAPAVAAEAGRDSGGQSFHTRDSFLLGIDPDSGEYAAGVNLNSKKVNPTITGQTEPWGASSGAASSREEGLEHRLMLAKGGSAGHDRSGGGYTGIRRSLSRTIGAGSEATTVWFVALHRVSGFDNQGNESYWNYDLGRGRMRWGIYEMSLHAFGTNIAPASAGTTYASVAKLEKNYTRSTDRWSVWFDPTSVSSETALGPPDATGTSDFWADAKGISKISIEIQGDSKKSEIGYVDELQIATDFDDLIFAPSSTSGHQARNNVTQLTKEQLAGKIGTNRLWTNASGKQITAKLVSVQQGTVALYLPTQKRVGIPFHKLSKEDQAWLLQSPGDPVPAPVTVPVTRLVDVSLFVGEVEIPNTKNLEHDDEFAGGGSRFRAERVRLNDNTLALKIHSLRTGKAYGPVRPAPGAEIVVGGLRLEFRQHEE